MRIAMAEACCPDADLHVMVTVLAAGTPPQWKRSAIFFRASRLVGKGDRAARVSQSLSEVEREIEGAIAFARNSRRPDADTALDFMYARTYPDFPARGWDA